MEIEVIRDNYKNSVNKEIMVICESDGRVTPTKEYKYEKIRERIRTS